MPTSSHLTVVPDHTTTAHATPEDPVLIDVTDRLTDWARSFRTRLSEAGRGRAALMLTGLILAVAAAVAAAVAVVRLVAGAAESLAAMVSTGIGWAAGHELTRMIAAPIRQFVTVHAAGLPVSAEVITLTWSVGGLVLLLTAATGARGARAAWPLFGAATLAAAWLGTTTAAHRPIVAGLLLLAWALLSIPVYMRHRRHQHRQIVVLDRPVPAER